MLSVNLLVAKMTKKEDKLLLRVRPQQVAQEAWSEAFQVLDQLATTQGAPSEILYDPAPPMQDVRSIPKGKGKGKGKKSE